MTSKMMAKDEKFWTRERVLVKYTSDDTLWHARWLLKELDEVEVAGRFYQCFRALTPDRDVVTEVLGPPKLLDIKHWPEGGQPADIKKGTIYSDIHSTAGKFKSGELNSFFVKETPRTRRVSKGPVLRGSKADSDSAIVPADRDKLAELRALLPQVQVGNETPRTNGIWITVSHSPEAKIGSRVELPSNAIQVGNYALVPSGGPAEVTVLKMINEDDFATRSSELVKVHRAEFSQAGGLGGASKFRLHEDGAARASDSISASSKDTRIMPILLDESGERWRTVAEASALCGEEAEYEDWPLTGPRSSRFLLKEHRRNGRTFLQSHAHWKAHSAVRSSDRAIHEHAVLSKCLELAVCYDQLQIQNLAAFEVVVRRRMLLEHAYRDKSDPNFIGAEHFMGYRTEEVADMVDPAIQRYQAARLKEEGQVLKEARIKREELAEIEKDKEKRQQQKKDK